jgi:hypothetical protein
MGLFKSAHHPAKIDPAERALALSLPPPAPPTQNAFPLRLPHHQCATPGADSLSNPHLRMNCADLAEDSCPGRISDHALVPSRTCIQALLPSRGNNDQAFPTPNSTRRVPAQWARTTRPPTPVRGPTAPSTPRSPHWRQEAYPKEGFRKAMKVFFFPKGHESFFFTGSEYEGTLIRE